MHAASTHNRYSLILFGYMKYKVYSGQRYRRNECSAKNGIGSNKWIECFIYIYNFVMHNSCSRENKAELITLNVCYDVI